MDPRMKNLIIFAVYDTLVQSMPENHGDLDNLQWISDIALDSKSLFSSIGNYLDFDLDWFSKSAFNEEIQNLVASALELNEFYITWDDFLILLISKLKDAIYSFKNNADVEEEIKLIATAYLLHNNPSESFSPLFGPVLKVSLYDDWLKFFPSFGFQPQEIQVLYLDVHRKEGYEPATAQMISQWIKVMHATILVGTVGDLEVFDAHSFKELNLQGINLIGQYIFHHSGTITTCNVPLSQEALKSILDKADPLRFLLIEKVLLSAHYLDLISSYRDLEIIKMDSFSESFLMGIFEQRSLSCSIQIPRLLLNHFLARYPQYKNDFNEFSGYFDDSYAYVNLGKSIRFAKVKVSEK